MTHAGALWAIAGFDFRCRLRTVSMWVYFVLYLVISALWMAASCS